MPSASGVAAVSSTSGVFPSVAHVFPLRQGDGFLRQGIREGETSTK